MKFNLTGKNGQPIDLGSPQNQAWLKLGLAVMLGVFCLYGTKTLVSRALYEQRVVSANHKALKQLEKNLETASVLQTQYNTLFENSNPINILGGKNDSSSQATPPDVDNARIALDALPTTYDYPALLASVTKIMTNNGIVSPNISGTDQTTSTSSIPSATPSAVAIKITISGAGTYSSVQNVFKDLERSVRPFDVSSLELSGSETNLSFTAIVTTYFQPAKTLGITKSRVD